MGASCLSSSMNISLVICGVMSWLLHCDLQPCCCTDVLHAVVLRRWLPAADPSVGKLLRFISAAYGDQVEGRETPRPCLCCKNSSITESRVMPKQDVRRQALTCLRVVDAQYTKHQKTSEQPTSEWIS